MTPHRLSVFLFAAILTMNLFMLGCASGSREGHSAQPQAASGSELAVGPDAADQLGYVPNWATSLALHGGQTVQSARVVASRGLLVVIEKPRNLASGISLDNGQLLWRQVIGPPDEPLYGGMAVNDNDLFFNSETSGYLLDAQSGEKKTISRLQTTVVAAPAVSGKYAVFGGRNGLIFAHNLRSGFSAWNYQLSSLIQTSPVISGQTAFAADSQGVYAAVAANTGELRWRNHTWGPVAGQPAMGQTDVYVPSLDNSLYAINQTTGRDNWIYRTNKPLRQGPTVIGRHIFQPVPGDGVHVIGATKGQLEWKFPTPAQPVAILKDQVLFQPGDSGLTLVDLESGQRTTQVSTQPLHSVHPGPDKSLIALTPKGRILRLNPKR